MAARKHPAAIRAAYQEGGTAAVQETATALATAEDFMVAYTPTYPGTPVSEARRARRRPGGL